MSQTIDLRMKEKYAYNTYSEEYNMLTVSIEKEPQLKRVIMVEVSGSVWPISAGPLPVIFAIISYHVPDLVWQGQRPRPQISTQYV